ncbi:UDP-glucosyltransferase family protein [Sesbania bispinosa]|nr:UDP-glucosyltransferase family protein [Sesbania bispinosa]
MRSCLLMSSKLESQFGAKQNTFWSSVSEEDAVVSRKRYQGCGIVDGRRRQRNDEEARKLGDAAKKTIEEGGHSYNNLIQLLDELKSLKKARQGNLKKTI